MIQLLIIWVSDYIHWVPRLLGLKVLLIERYDITPSVNRSTRKAPESKVSWLVKNISHAPLSLKAVIKCTLCEDADLQIYPISENGQYGFDTRICCGEVKFDTETKEKSKKFTAPPQQLIKIDYFASQEPHPFFRNWLPDFVHDDPSAINRITKLIETPSGNKWKFAIRTLILVSFFIFALLFLGYLIMTYARPILNYWTGLIG